MSEKKYNFDDDQSVADLLGTLPRVGPPLNFDARVRSRISQGRPSAGRWLVPSMAAASLFAIFLAVAVFVYIRVPNEQIASTDEPGVVAEPIAESAVPQFSAASEPEPANVNMQQPRTRDVPPPAVAEKRDRPVSRRKPSAEREGGGSYRIAAEELPAPIVPFGTPTPRPSPAASIEPTVSVSKIPVRDILRLIGLDSEFEDGGWRVRKVIENSAAARSGIREGDVVEMIDEVKVLKNTTLETGFNGKNVTVLRNGNRQTINLHNR